MTKIEKNWTPYLECKNSTELFIRLHQAEIDQIKIEKAHNCRMVEVRGELVAGVDDDTEVHLQLSTENCPAICFRRRGTNLMVMVFLRQWER